MEETPLQWHVSPRERSLDRDSALEQGLSRQEFWLGHPESSHLETHWGSKWPWRLPAQSSVALSSPGQPTHGCSPHLFSGDSWERHIKEASAWMFDNPFFPLCGWAVAHTPDNSFMGFVSEELNETEKQLIKDGKASNMAVVYGKEASIWKVSPGKPTASHAGSNAGCTHCTC